MAHVPAVSFKSNPIGFVITNFNKMSKWQKITAVALLAISIFAAISGLIYLFTHVVLPFCLWTLLVGSALAIAPRIFSSHHTEQFNFVDILHKIKSKEKPVLGLSAGLTLLTIIFPSVMIPVFLGASAITGIAIYKLGLNSNRIAN